MSDRPELGLIEGYYGRPWEWSERESNARFLAEHGFAFYHYAPKADPYLRKRWRDPYPDDEAQRLASLAGVCRDAGLRFGVGFSPYEIFRAFDDDARTALRRKLDLLDQVGIDDLALLFDDMRGDSPHLARSQLEVVGWVAERTGADRLVVCPTYYSDDPVLDRVFGARPDHYLDDLGAGLDPAIEIFWTGPEVVARELTPGHLERVSDALRRRPFLWDNYPVNDGARMSKYLHVRGFTGRPPELADRVAAHAINPALQPTLTRIPLLTLLDRYDLGPEYDYRGSTAAAARAVAGETLGGRIAEDVLDLQEVGLDRLDEERTARLRERYGRSDHAAAREIMTWLDGGYAITDEIVRTQ